MSGIGGLRAFSPGILFAEVLHDMARLLEHRGPDDAAVWLGADVGLAHTRLAVVDAVHSRQPMHSVDGRWVLALDGTITNHVTLRTHLDYPFRTRGDTEVVLAGLALQGISFVERLEGHFALVAHDLRTDTTHLVRDRLGVRPLHYRHVPGGIAFGSEIQALLTVGPPAQVDARSLDAYLAYGSVAAPHTLFEGVKKVLPAHRVSIMPGGHLEEAHYWVPPECDADGTWTATDAVEAVGDGVREAVRAALVTDVPVGAHLSGGLDSSLVVAQAQQLRGDEALHTFSAAFGDTSDDEPSWALATSSLLGTRHHEVRVRDTDVRDNWALLTRHLDAPASDPVAIALHSLARTAGDHVRVVLSGDGADQLFAGCARHRHARLSERSARMHARLGAGLAGPLERRLVPALFSASERERLLGSPAPPERRTAAAPGADAVDRMLRHELRRALPDAVLEPADRLTMAASLELRPALLDHHLVELALRLPTSVKLRSGTTKWVLREAARRLLPDDVANRPQQSVRVPLDAWLRAGLREPVQDRLTGDGSWVCSTFDRSLVRDVVERHDRGADGAERLWRLACLEMWHECFIGAVPLVPRPRGVAADRPLAEGPHR
ncbi:asparagine synthase (glutamine-hydrolyzing) [Nocardioides xinjiangensis]|uniref:asparagine synthase (glutamine-hydrolyzing) n=1 Tax=Nocardioides xinjiangensis TaxID=2817376 RepID=UPI001B3086F6|nr:MULTISPECIES: asparagine synthase (glutamine-hydrolyzing) [unclassified Nocardioides]